MGRRTTDLAGQNFGRLTVKARVLREPGAPGQAKWLCLCNPDLGGCGVMTSIGSNALRSGATQSCGCLHRERLATRNTARGNAGGLAPRAARPRAYSSWRNMIRRCTKVTDPRYPDWGGRGITIDPRWMIFTNFLADMGERPPGLTLERKDNDGPYAKWNCVWATPAQQQRNTRARKHTWAARGHASDDPLLSGPGGAYLYGQSHESRGPLASGREPGSAKGRGH